MRVKFYQVFGNARRVSHPTSQLALALVARAWAAYIEFPIADVFV